MGSFGVVVVPPPFDNNLGFPQRVEDFAVEQFVSHPSIEAFTVAVLPWRSWLDICSRCSNCFDPAPDGLSDKLRAIVRPDISWNTTQDEQVRESVDDLSRVELSFHSDRQTFPAVFIQDVERPKGSAVVCPVMHEVIRPDVIAILRT